MSAHNADRTQNDEAAVYSDVIYRPLRPVSDPAAFYPGLEPEVVTLPRGSTYGPTGAEGPAGSRWHGGTRALPTDILFERDVAVTLRDGTVIYVDIYRPPGATDVPAIMARWFKNDGYVQVFARGDVYVYRRG